MKYKVRFSFRVESTDFADYEVEASSMSEARLKALEDYNNSEGALDLDYYAGDEFDTELETDSIDDWLVEEVE